MKIEATHIEKIIGLFQEAKVWNNGKFSDAVSKYCNENSLNEKQVHLKLKKAFNAYLATNISSENSIRHFLSQ